MLWQQQRKSMTLRLGWCVSTWSCQKQRTIETEEWKWVCKWWNLCNSKWTSMTWTNVDKNYVNVKHRTWFVANLGTSYFISSETSELLFICDVYSRNRQLLTELQMILNKWKNPLVERMERTSACNDPKCAAVFLT